MSPQEQRARTVVLAQALEEADTQGRLADADQRTRATQSALRASSPTHTGQGELPAAELVHLRAAALIGSATVAHPSLALLERPRPWWRWLLVGAPLLALLLGIATDRISDPHRVDLLSLPLLAVIGWNLLMYLWLLVAWLPWRAARGTSPALLGAVRHWAQSFTLPGAHGWRGGSRSALAGVAARFHLQWHRLTETLTLYRSKTVLHLAAAAWGAGLALSLLLRGLVVQYQVGWESTFLQAEQVHLILKLLFLPLTLLFSLAPFTVDEVAALRNFALPGEAGRRWVFLYAGLLALVVVAPRLLLAAWSAWRARTLSRAMQVSLEPPYYQDLLAKLRPARLAIGLAPGDARNDAQLLRLLRQSADEPAALSPVITSAGGDQLRWVDEQLHQPVDVVLRIAGTANPEPLPPAWDGQPVVACKLASLEQSWLQMALILEALRPRLPAASMPGFARLTAEWQQRHDLRFDQSMGKIADYLLSMARQLEDSQSTENLTPPRDRLLSQLFELHRLDAAAAQALEEKLTQKYLPVSQQSGGLFAGKPQTTAAGAAAGATMGGAIDLATAGLSLGAAAALGGLLGAGFGWVMAARKKKELAGDTLQALTQAALLLYLEVANVNRIRSTSDDASSAWPPAIAVAVKQHWKAFEPVWAAARNHSPSASADAGNTAGDLAKVLTATAQSCLAGLFSR